MYSKTAGNWLPMSTAHTLQDSLAEWPMWGWIAFSRLLGCFFQLSFTQEEPSWCGLMLLQATNQG